CARAKTTSARGEYRAFRLTGVTEYWIGTAASVRLDVSSPNYLAPFLGFVGDELAEVGRRAWKCGGAPLGKPKTIAVPEKALADKIAALRGSIGDPTSVQRGFARLDECGTVDARGLARVDCRTLGFDFSLAHEIYDTLFGQIAADIKDKKHLIVVPSGALTSLPFQVLITEKPEGTQRLSDAAWLIKRHAITVLPSVASLRALRAFANGTRTGKPFIGFGDPVFQKAPTDPTNRGGMEQRVASNETVRDVSDE